ncbi:MAG: cytochrome b/b6 domain-containing protein [Gammaproteobacteria bacterium]|nr:cytochrome b/b6 domain-containing protein [Gammaproteobacteria bacterium]MDH3433112.1 cytochrome b/b6 domain-containing protein [Gammaproteobacteria bacterium]
MALRNTSAEFGSIAKWLHWLIAAGILLLIYLGLEQAAMERGPEKLAARETHGAIALIVFVLMTIRLVWRWVNAVPAHPAETPAWQRISATLVHWGLYIAVFVQLISGPITVATGGRSIPFFGLFSISLPVAENEDDHHLWEEVHEFAWTIVALLLVVHVLAALYNHFIAKNDVLRRMTTGARRGD